VDLTGGPKPLALPSHLASRGYDLTMATTAPPKALTHVRIRGDAGRPPIDLAEVWRSRDLLWTLTDRDIRLRYKQTALGVIWVVIQPLMASMIFAFVFGVVAKLPSNGQPYILFAFASLLAWNTFAQALSKSANSLVANSHMITKVYFPRLSLPLASVSSTLVDFVISLGVMFVLLAVYRVWPGPGVLLVPVWLAILLVMALGLGLLSGSLMVKYRDVAHLIPTFLQLGLYATPVAWATIAVPARFRWVFVINPLSGLMDAFRWSLLGVGSLSFPMLAYSTATAVALFWLGAVVFKHQERSFADVI